MKNPKLIFVYAVIIVFLIEALPSVHALEYGSYQNSWYALKCKFNGICDFNDSEGMVKNCSKEKAWLYIDNADSEFFDALLLTMDLSGVWQKIELSLLPQLGTSSDIILELENPIIICDGKTGDEVTIRLLYIRLKGKEKNSVLKNAKLSTVVGIELINLNDSTSCYGSIQISGSLKRESNVPDEVKALLP